MSGIGVLDYPKARIEMAELPDKRLNKFRLGACWKEPWTVAWIETMRLGECLWDVGANVGSYSLLAATRGLSVIAVEPLWPNVRMLRENVERNRLGNAVACLQVALGAENGPLTVRYAADRPGGVVADEKDAGARVETVMRLTMDDLARVFGVPVPHHVKVDVDGGELEVLLGGRAVLSHPQVRSLLVEVKTGLEGRVDETAGQLGFALGQVFDTRDGVPIQGITYRLYGRPA